MNSSNRSSMTNIFAQIVAGETRLRPVAPEDRRQANRHSQSDLHSFLQYALESRRHSVTQDQPDDQDTDSNIDPDEWQVDSPTTTHRVTQHSPRYPASSTTRRTTIVAQAPHQTRQGLTREQQLARNTLQQQRHLDETTTNNNLHQYNDTFEKFKNAYKAGEDPLSFSKQFEQHRQYFEERWQIKITPSDFLCCSTTYELLNIPCLIPNSTKPYDLNSIIKSKKANENFFKDPNSRKTFNHNQITGDDYRATFIESMLTELHQLYHQLNPPEATTTLITSNVIEKLNNIDGLRVTNLTIVLHQAHHATLYSKTGANSENVTDQQTTHGKEALSKPHI